MVETKTRAKRYDTYLAVLVGVLTLGLYLLAYPPYDVAEAAYVVMVPYLLWVSRKPGKREIIILTCVVSWATWFSLLLWLRHLHPPVGWLAAAALSFVLAWFTALWMLVAAKVFPVALRNSFLPRLALVFGLAGLWVILEWSKAWLFTGFPWMHLSISQWQRPAILQPAAWCGHYGVSFILIFFNISLAVYFWRLFPRGTKTPGVTLGSRRYFLRVCPEFYIALFMLCGAFYLYLIELPKTREREPMFKAAVVQPWIPAILKWNEAYVDEIISVLERETHVAAAYEPDVILWPEAATPFPLLDESNDAMLRWVERLVNAVDVPLLSGNLAAVGDIIYNGIFFVEPKLGLMDIYYYKRQLVTFGEYVPFRDWLPFLGKVVPLEQDVSAGEEAIVIPMRLKTGTWNVGSLICNEDAYGGLAREMVQEGADFLYVATNDAWYGQESGAYKHAANSVLRAVECRRPVVRCGNHGWSGWIDELGRIRQVATGKDGSIYFRGTSLLNVSATKAYVGTESFYTRHGDWFVGVCGALSVFGMLVFLRGGDSRKGENDDVDLS